MTMDDLRKLATGSVLFNLDRIITPRLVTVLYLLGLSAILLWAINHLFYTFAFGFGAGLWGLVEIAVFGLLAFVVLRVSCESLIVFFKANEKAADSALRPHPQLSLIDEVRDAIEELADEETKPALAAQANAAKPATPASKAAATSGASSTSTASKPAARKPVKRTARRTPTRSTPAPAKDS